jgi:hypothetical protein
MKPVKYNQELTIESVKAKILRVTAYAVGTSIVGTVLYIAYRRFTKNKSQNLALNDNSVENFAQRLKMGFDNNGVWGTEVETVRKVFVDIPSKEVFANVIKSYKKQFGKNLIEDLANELTTTEYYEMQNILASKPDKTGQHQVFDFEKAKKFAKRFKAAFDYTILGMPSTDKGALTQVLLDIPSKQIFEIIKVAYQSLYGTALESDLDSELDLFDFSWRDMIKQKPLK